MEKQSNKRDMKRTAYLGRRFLPYLKPYLGTLTMDLLCCLVTCLCELVLPLIVRHITSTASRDIALLTICLIASMGVLYLVLRLLDLGAEYYRISRGHIMGSRIEADMRRDMFAHLQELSNSYYDVTKTGQLMSRITTDLNDVTEFAHHFPEEIFIAIVKVGASFLILIRVNVPLTLMIYLSIPLMLFFSSRYNLGLRRTMKESRHRLGELNAQVEDSLLGIRTVKAFAGETVEQEKFRSGNRSFLGIKKAMYSLMGAFHATIRLLDGLMYLMVVVAGALFIRVGQISPSDLVSYILYVNMLLASVRRLVEFTEQFQRGVTGIERFVEIMDEPVEIHDAPDAIDIANVKGDILFDHVSFTYRGTQEEVLTDINLSVPSGASIALVGPSGGGKTTLCSLIPRFYEVTSGRILLDGVDIRHIKLNCLRSQIGVVQQDVYLFAGSVRDNIEYGKPGASMEEIERAARLAGAHEFIEKLENGYDTPVGERGVRLSGGQKQRISIARVFLKNPPVLILDEATSALDNESEYLVQQSLDRLMKGRTTFTIAHRLSTIRGARCILVLTDKGIVEEGTHNELMAKKGVYYQMQHVMDNARE